MPRAALLLVVLLAACAPKGGSGPRDPRPGMVFAGAPLSALEEDRCREAWAFYLRAFESDYPQAVIRWRSLTVHNATTVDGVHGGLVKDGHVAIVSDTEQTCTASYHEMCHIMLVAEGTNGDPTHSDPRWTAWTQRQQALIFALIDDRIARNGRSGP